MPWLRRPSPWQRRTKETERWRGCSRSTWQGRHILQPQTRANCSIYPLIRPASFACLGISSIRIHRSWLELFLSILFSRRCDKSFSFLFLYIKLGINKENKKRRWIIRNKYHQLHDLKCSVSSFSIHLDSLKSNK